MVCGALLGNCGTIVAQYSDNCGAVVAQVFLRARIVQSWTSQAASVVFATDFTYSTQGVAKLYPSSGAWVELGQSDVGTALGLG